MQFFKHFDLMDLQDAGGDLSSNTVSFSSQGSHVVRKKKAARWLLAVKGAFQNFAISSCTSGKNGTETDCGGVSCSATRSQSSSHKHSGQSGEFQSSPMFVVTQKSMAIHSELDSDSTTTLDWGSLAKSSSEPLLRCCDQHLVLLCFP